MAMKGLERGVYARLVIQKGVLDYLEVYTIEEDFPDELDIISITKANCNVGSGQCSNLA